MWSFSIYGGGDKVVLALGFHDNFGLYLYMIDKPLSAAFISPFMLHTGGLNDSLSPLEVHVVV